MKISNKIVNNIASESKAVCSADGYGQGLAVFRNGDVMISLSPNDIIARGDGHGGWEYRVGYIRRPLTRAEVREYLDNIVGGRPPMR